MDNNCCAGWCHAVIPLAMPALDTHSHYCFAENVSTTHRLHAGVSGCERGIIGCKAKGTKGIGQGHADVASACVELACMQFYHAKLYHRHARQRLTHCYRPKNHAGLAHALRWLVV